ncbi:MAG: DNA repair protein RecO [Methylococcales bacterium]
MSTNQSNSLHQAYVLHRRVFRETSLIVELFARDIGRVTVVAKGAQRKKSQFAGVLEPFNPMRVSWIGRSEMGTLTLAERCSEPLRLSSQTLFCGMYLNELIINLLERHDPHPILYDHYQASLGMLHDGQQLEPTLRQFELILLEEIGYGLHLENDACSGKPVVADLSYRYQFDQGLVVAEVSDRATISGSTLVALAQGQLRTTQQKREAKQLLRQVIDHHLEGKPLRSRDLFRTIQSSHNNLD